MLKQRIKYPSINKGNDKKAIASLSQIAETLIGASGDGLDRAVTFRDLNDLNVINISRNANGRVISSSTGGTTGNGGGAGAVVVNTPTIPTGVSATGGYSAILINWDFPTYGGHAYTEIWRSLDNVLGNADLIATTNSTSYSDFQGNEYAAYYWIRHVNRDIVRGPYNDTSGLFAQTAVNVDFALEVLNGQISDVHLNSFLSGRISLINDVNNTVSAHNSLLASLSGAFDSNGDGTVDLNERLEFLQQQLSENRIDSDNGFVSVTDGLLVATQDNDDVFEEVAQILGKVTALENVLIDPDTGIPTTTALLLDEYYTRTATDEAISASFTEYQISVNGEAAGLQEWAQVAYTANNNFDAQWGVKATVGQLTGGIGFVNNGSVTQLTVAADRFAVIDPRDDEVNSIFTVVSNDPVLPDGVYIDSAFIRVATASEIIAGDIVADKVVAAIDITTPAIDGGSITGADILLQAGSYELQLSPDTTFPVWFGSSSISKNGPNARFAVNNQGNVYARGIEIRDIDGDVILDSGGIDGTYIKDLSVDSLKLSGEAVTLSVPAQVFEVVSSPGSQTQTIDIGEYVGGSLTYVININAGIFVDDLFNNQEYPNTAVFNINIRIGDNVVESNGAIIETRFLSPGANTLCGIAHVSELTEFIGQQISVEFIMTVSVVDEFKRVTFSASGFISYAKR